MIKDNDGWLTEKPEFKEECVLVTAIKINSIWEYSIWRIERVHDDGGIYMGWLMGDGEEYGDLSDLKADLYKVIKPLNTK